MAPPHGDRKKGKGPGKPELRPSRKEFKKHRKEEEEVEKGGGSIEEEQQEQPAPHAAALFNAADDGDFPRGE